MRIIELPLALCPPGRLALAVLAQRSDGLTLHQQVWLGDDYAFDGSTPPASYDLLATHNRFARHGRLIGGYPASTLTVDQVGVIVELDGVDKTLPETSAFSALADDLMLFVGDEILSVFAAELVVADTYRLSVIRGRLGTRPELHAAGAEAYLVGRDELLALTHPSFQVGHTTSLKVTLATQRLTQDLADVEAIELAVAGRIFSQARPVNLTVNGDVFNPRYVATTDVEIAWSLPSDQRVIERDFGCVVETLLEIVSDVDSSVLHSEAVAGNTLTIAGAAMDTIRDSEPTFTVRLSTVITGEFFQVASPTLELKVIEA